MKLAMFLLNVLYIALTRPNESTVMECPVPRNGRKNMAPILTKPVQPRSRWFFSSGKIRCQKHMMGPKMEGSPLEIIIHSIPL